MRERQSSYAPGTAASVRYCMCLAIWHSARSLSCAGYFPFCASLDFQTYSPRATSASGAHGLIAERGGEWIGGHDSLLGVMLIGYNLVSQEACPDLPKAFQPWGREVKLSSNALRKLRDVSCLLASCTCSVVLLDNLPEHARTLQHL